MKLSRLLTFCFFSMSFLAGLSIGRQISPLGKDDAPGSAARPLNPLANNQYTILLIIIDQYSPTANLVGAWEILYPISYRSPTWVPVYPNQALNPQKDSLLAASFGLNKNVQPKAIFLRALQQRGLQWSGYLVLDVSAVAEMIDFFGQPSAGSGSDLLSRITSVQGDAQAALQNQSAAIGALCDGMQYAAGLPTPPHFLDLYQRIQDRVTSDLDLPALFTSWQGFLQLHSGPTCKIPTPTPPKP